MTVAATSVETSIGTEIVKTAVIDADVKQNKVIIFIDDIKLAFDLNVVAGEIEKAYERAME